MQDILVDLIDETIVNKKAAQLKEVLRSYGKTALAFSGGVDSTFLLKMLSTVSENSVTAVTVKSIFFPAREEDDARTFCSENGISHRVIDFDVTAFDDICSNPENRCYLCKKQIFSCIRETAAELGMDTVCDGTNADDLNDYRPGLKALKELDVKSPLALCGLTKKEIIFLCEKMNLAVSGKSSFACLASRIPYGEKITPEKISVVEKAEELFHSLGFRQFRVRLHSGSLARIEVLPEEMEKAFLLRKKIQGELEELGIVYVCLDLAGYKTGSLNRLLSEDKK